MDHDEESLQRKWVNAERNVSCRVDTTSRDALGVCRVSRERGETCVEGGRKRDGGERRYEPRESASRRGTERLIERRGGTNLGNH